MNAGTTFVRAIIYCTFLLVSSSAGDETDLDWRNQVDCDEFEEQALVKDPGPPLDPDSSTITSGDCSDYIDLSGLPLPIEVAGTTVGASNDYGPFTERPFCWGGIWDEQSGAGPDVAFKWTASTAGEYTISLCESDFDNCLILYEFTCPDEPSYPDDFICGRDDVCEVRAKIRFVHLDEGEEILIVVDGYGSNEGHFEVRIYESELDSQSVDWFINAQMETFHIPGAAACIVKDGQIAWSDEYGMANIERNIEVADTTLFVLASVSKIVTATAVMQLWEDSLVELDTDINDYLPFNVRNHNYPNTPITSRMLMTHTSSINDRWLMLDTLRSWGEDSPNSSLSK